MRRPRHTWQLIVFVGAILLPSVALFVVGQRTIEQNLELAGKRRLDEQRAAKERIAREMLALLETLKRAAMANPGAGSDSPIALVARVEAGHLVLPWESDPARFRELTTRPPGFAASLARGEQAEFAARDPDAAARAYADALRAVVNPFQSAYARLLLASVLDRQRRTAEAAAEARQVLRAPVDMVDEDGVPLCVRAAALLLASPPDRAAVRRVLTLAAEARALQSPTAAFTLSSLADQLQQLLPAGDRAWVVEFRSRIAANIRVQEQLQALQNDAARLGLLEPRKSVWTFYQGAEPWLLATDSAEGRQVLVIAVRALDVFRPFEAAGNLHFFASTEPGGELLADSFPGLKVLFAAADVAGSTGSRLASGLYYAALIVLVGATAFGTSLLWRSLRREMELAETRSQFVASVSHELKTPLTAIRMFAETLQMGRSQDKEVQNEYLETISNECERLSRLVDDVLLFSKIEQGKNVYRFRRVALADSLRKAAHTLSYPLAQHGFELRMDLDEDLPAVDADPDAIEQAVLNLLTNAMKYSGESKQIDLRLKRRNGEAAIEVADYGIGIAAEELTRIFEKYYRAAAPENQTIPGTGLGLTLVAQIVKAHGGRVEVESAPGKGSTFTIRLPLASET